jgi:hypothetical protein
VFVQQVVDMAGKPGRMAWLADDASLEPLPEFSKELVGYSIEEGQAWRQLNQQRAELGPQAFYFGDESIQQFTCARQATLVGDRLRDLYGKPEVIGD